MTQAAYARYKGKDRSLVTRWKKDGRLVMTKDCKHILVKESDENLKRTTNLNNSFNEKQAADDRTFRELKKQVGETQLDLETDNADELYKNSRALREKSAALQAAAEHEKFMGTVVSLEVVEKIMFERGRQFRDGLMTCSRRLAPEISGNDDIKEIEDVLSREFRGLLENFTKLPVVE